MAYVLPAGSSATANTLATGTTSSGAAVALNFLVTIGGSTFSTAMSDVTGVSDTTIQRLPARFDKGTLQLTMFLDDTATATNQWTVLRTRQTNKTHTRISVGLPGSSIDDMYNYDGYISEVSTPEVGTTDEALRYTVTLQLSDKY
jgi:hypothetical protein